uniref:Uncharacterized protein n=1 Tax=Leersia perrieri TaxID=77586 RepID=A0A0D9X517_9ORYZ
MRKYEMVEPAAAGMTEEKEGPVTMTNLTTIGLLVIMVAVSASVSVHGSYGLLVGLLGVIVGSNLIYLGVKTAGNLVAIFLGTIASLVAKYPRRNFATVGLIMVSFAVGGHLAASDDTYGPAISFMFFLVLLFGQVVVTLGVHGGLDSST